MRKGIYNTIRLTMGKRLRNAREEKGLKRPQLAESLNESKLAPSNDMNQDRIKQWEYGNNAIAIDWIPALCEVLSFDVGYLFSEYPERQRLHADIAQETGLQEDTISKLLFEKNNCRFEQFNQIVLDNDFWEILNFFNCYKDVSEQLFEENRKLSDLFWKMAKDIDNDEVARQHERAATALDMREYNYEMNRYRCKILFDNIIGRFLPLRAKSGGKNDG